MIQGYFDDASAFPGSSITFHVATDAPEFRIEFYRQGPTLQDIGFATDWLAGSPGEDHDADHDFGAPATRGDGRAVDGWQAYPFKVPDWQTGVYIAMFQEGDGNHQPNPNQNPPPDRTTADARTGKALLVVKNPTPGYDSQVLYKIPLFTYQMYNMTQYTGIDGTNYAGAGYSFFDYHTGKQTQELWVTLHRPGGGTGGTPWDSVYYGPKVNGIPTGNLDPFDPSLRQTFVHWDAKMISWLEGSGIPIDYCTDMDIHRDGVDLPLLSPYALVLSVGHDEYYSVEMRDRLEAFVANGGNIAFFSGNTCYWRLVFPMTDANGQPDLRFITRFGKWYEIGRPEDSLTGVGFRHGGERDYELPPSEPPRIGYTVQNKFLWPFEGSGLNENGTFGEDLRIVGYECDGAPYDHNAPRPVSPTFTGGDSTPGSLVILGTGVVRSWPGPANVNGSATMAMYNNNGTVFTGATTDWPRLLASGDGPTTCITRNVLNRLGGSPKRLAKLTTVEGTVAVDGFWTPDDQYRHAIVAQQDGTLTEIFYHPQKAQGQAAIANLPATRDVAAFYSDDDQYRHAIVAQQDGTLTEIYFHPQHGTAQAPLGVFPGVVAVAGFYSGDDQYRHVIVAQQDGTVTEIYYHPQKGQGQANLGTFAGVIDVGGFYSSDDQYRHAIVGTSDGTVTEIYYHPNTGTSQTKIGNIADLARLSGYYASGDPFFDRRIQGATSGGRIHEVRYSPRAGTTRVVLFNPGALVDISGFYTNDDGYRNSIFCTPTGDMQELSFKP